MYLFRVSVLLSSWWSSILWWLTISYKSYDR